MAVKTMSRKGKPAKGDTISKNGKRVPAERRGKDEKREPKTHAAANAQAAATPPKPAVKPKPYKVPTKYAAFSGSICGTLAQIRVRRQNAANEEHNAVEYIKTLDQWMTNHGDPGAEPPDGADAKAIAEHSEKLDIYQAKCTEYVRAEQARDSARASQRWLAKRYDAVIDLAIEPDLNDEATADKLRECMDGEPPPPLFKIAAEKTRKDEDDGDKSAGVPEHDDQTDDGSGVFTYPGAFKVRSYRIGTPVQTVKASDGDDLMNQVRTMWQDAPVEIDERKGELLIDDKPVGEITQEK